ncbi:MAG: flagellar protein FliS [Deltaproteobacteria bacterium]|nr:flagellar protein FliS [Deltaproteobacteria bacterium]
MNHSAALDRYRTIHEKTMPPEQVLLRLLEGLCATVAQAKAAVVERDIQAKTRAVDRALCVIGELTKALDASVAPDLAARLMGLYAFTHRQLLEGSATLDPAAFDHAARVLNVIHSAFRDAVSAPLP